MFALQSGGLSRRRNERDKNDTGFGVQAYAVVSSSTVVAVPRSPLQTPYLERRMRKVCVVRAQCNAGAIRTAHARRACANLMIWFLRCIRYCLLYYFRTNTLNINLFFLFDLFN